MYFLLSFILFVLHMFGFTSSVDVNTNSNINRVPILDTPLIGLHSYYPFGSEYLSPPINGYYPYLRSPFGNYLNVVEGPVIVLIKTSNEIVKGYLLTHGLQSIGNETHTSEIKMYLSDGERKALLINSQNFAIIKDYEVEKIVFPEQLHLSNLMILQNYQIPWILLLDLPEYDKYKKIGLNKISEIEISNNGVKIVNELPFVSSRRI